MDGIRLFTYNPYNGEFYINIETIRLTKEFNELWLYAKKQCKCDDVNDNVEVDNQDMIQKYQYVIQKYTDYCKYIYLTESWSSPYSDYDNRSKHISSLQDAGLEEDEVNFPELQNAILKFREVQLSDRNYRLLDAARKQVDSLISYFLDDDKLKKTIDGKPLYKPKDITDELKKVDELSDYLDKTEERIKKGEISKNRIKGDAVEGFIVDFVKERERREKEIIAREEKKKKEREEKRLKAKREFESVLNPKNKKHDKSK